jgi:glycosyltransferase involved in cell wall biosynthesis
LAQLLLHPARFHAAGIVISEAAAFGLPTHHQRGRRAGYFRAAWADRAGLPAGSPAAAYADAIKALMREPERYQAMRANARRRFDAELDWEKAGERLVGIVRAAAGDGE